MRLWFLLLPVALGGLPGGLLRPLIAFMLTRPSQMSDDDSEPWQRRRHEDDVEMADDDAEPWIAPGNDEPEGMSEDDKEPWSADSDDSADSEDDSDDDSADDSSE